MPPRPLSGRDQRVGPRWQSGVAGRCGDRPGTRAVRRVRADLGRQRKGRGRRRLRLLQPAGRAGSRAAGRHAHRGPGGIACRCHPGHRRRQPRRARNHPRPPALPHAPRHRRRRPPAHPVHPATPPAGDGAAARGVLPARRPLEAAGPGPGVRRRTGGSRPGLRRRCRGRPVGVGGGRARQRGAPSRPLAGGGAGAGLGNAAPDRDRTGRPCRSLPRTSRLHALPAWSRRVRRAGQLRAGRRRFAADYPRRPFGVRGPGARRRHGDDGTPRRREPGRCLRLPARHRRRVRVSHRRRAPRVRAAHTRRVRRVLSARRHSAAHPARPGVHPHRTGPRPRRPLR